ncbi:MAG: heparinase II/III family protein [Carnobacterium sp.]
MDKSYLIRKIHANKLGDTQGAIKNANRLLKNKFVFEHPYDMEPCHEEFEMVEIDWLFTPNEDVEWIFMLNRQEYLLDLLIAYQISDQSKYIEKAKDIILDWISKCEKEDTLAWRTIDTGIRIIYWSILLNELLKINYLSVEEKEIIENSLVKQVNYLNKNYISKYDLSNWGILISSGVIVTANLHPLLVSKEIYEKHESCLIRQTRLQVQKSGLHWEQSPLYFMEVWRHLVVVWLSYKNTLNECPKAINETIKEMLNAAPHLVKPNGYILQQGDTDKIKIDDMIQTVSLLFQEPIPSINARTVSIDLLIATFTYANKKLVSMNLSKELAYLASNSKQKYLLDYETGNFFIRDKWEDTASFLHVFNGPLGSGHGHASLGHIDYSLNGEDILIDLGRYSYREIPERLTLKKAESHNVLILNDNPFTVIEESWKYTKSTTPLANRSVWHENVFITQVSYLEEQGDYNIMVNRTVIWIPEEELLIIFNYCKGNGFHKVEQFLNLDPQIEVSRLEDNKFKLKTPKQEVYTYTDISENNVEKTLFSEIYNKKGMTSRIVSTSNFENTFISYTVLSSREDLIISLADISQSGTTDVVPIEKCVGLSIKSGEQEHLFSLQHEDTFSGHKLYFLNEEPVYGKVTWIIKDPIETTYKRLI